LGESERHLFSNPAERDALLEQLKQIPFKVPSAREVAQRMSEEDVQTMSIDVRSFMQRHPYIVHGDARLSRAYRQFRTMGLRHMYVMPARPRVVGLLTRKDVIPERASLTLGLYARGLAHPTRTRASGTFDTRDPAGASRSAEFSSSAEDVEFQPSRRGDFTTRHVDPGTTDGGEHDDTATESLPFLPYYANNDDVAPADADALSPRRRAAAAAAAAANPNGVNPAALRRRS